MFLAIICVFAFVGSIMALVGYEIEVSAKGKVIAVVVLIVSFIALVSYFASSSGSSSGTRWSQLSDVEKDNARWAYNAQQAINNRK